jgi:hypothetical protein
MSSEILSVENFAPLGTNRIISTHALELEKSVLKIREFLKGSNERIRNKVNLHIDSNALQEKELKDFSFGRPLKEIPAYMLSTVNYFRAYLVDTSNYSFLVHGFDNNKQEETWKNIPYIHRWTAIYRKSILAKLMQLQNSIGEEIKDFCLVTLTVYQRNVTYEQALRKLLKSYNLLKATLFKMFKTIDFFYVIEAHKSGYPHMHLLYCRVLSSVEKNRIRKLWSEKYHAGDKFHGIHFSDSARKSYDNNYKEGSIKKIKSYLMKYMAKGLFNGENEPSPAEWVFNATLKKTKTRLWNCSRNFSKIMSRVNSASYVPPNPDWECKEVFLQDARKEDSQLLWSKEHKYRTDLKVILTFICSSTIEPDYEKETMLGRTVIKKNDRYYVYKKKDVSIYSQEKGDIEYV